MTTSTAARTVGQFSIEAGVVSGPAEYMAERGSARLRRIEAGQDVVFNYGCTASPNMETAILVSLQTDYSAWLGQREFAARQREARASQLAFLEQMRAARR